MLLSVNFLYVVLAVLFTTFIGYGVLLFLEIITGSRPSPYPTYLRFCLSYYLGFGIIYIETVVLSLLKIKFSVWLLILLWLPVLIFDIYCVIVKRNNASIRNSLNFENRRSRLFWRNEPGINRVFKVAFVGLFSLSILYVVIDAMHLPIFGWDACSQWIQRAKVCYVTRQHAFIQPDFWPIANTWIFVLTRNIDDVAIRLNFACFFLLSGPILYYGFRENKKKKIYSLICIFALFTAPRIIQYATSGYADVPLGVLFGGGCIFLFLWMKKLRTLDLVIAALFTAFAASTKNEGMFQAVIITAILFGFILTQLFYDKNVRENKRRYFLWPIIFILIVVMYTAPAYFVRQFLKAGQFTSVPPSFEKWNYIYLIEVPYKFLSVHLLDIKQFGFIFIAFFFLIAIKFQEILKSRIKWLVLTYLVEFVLLVIIYNVAHFHLTRLYSDFSSSFPRVVLHQLWNVIFIIGLLLPDFAFRRS